MIQHIYNKLLQAATRSNFSSSEQWALKDLVNPLRTILTEEDSYEGWHQLKVIAEAQIKRIAKEANLASFDENFGD